LTTLPPVSIVSACAALTAAEAAMMLNDASL
jgi:hypothetical protein